jgi:hypothetical protein
MEEDGMTLVLIQVFQTSSTGMIQRPLSIMLAMGPHVPKAQANQPSLQPQKSRKSRNLRRVDLVGQHGEKVTLKAVISGDDLMRRFLLDVPCSYVGEILNEYMP